MPWMVHATPGRHSTFPKNYFPRAMAYKKDALARAEEARQDGCTGVRVEKVKKGKSDHVDHT